MAKQQCEKQDGIILKAFSGGKFSVKLLSYEEPIIAYAAGKMIKNWIKIRPGDKVEVEMSPSDITRGRIVFRYKNSR